MRFRYHITFLMFGCVILGCNPKYYVPNTQNVPVITSKGQADVTASGNANQLEIQSAYGLSNEWALQVNGAFISPADEDNGNGGSGKLIEAGVGYYKNITPVFLFSTYGLIGFGTMENHFPTTVDEHPSTTGDISANVLRFGIQPALSYHNEYLSVSGSARLMSLNYSGIEGSLIFNDEDQTAYLDENRSSLLFEPGITIRAGLEKIKLQIQLTRSFNLTNSDFRQDDTLLTVGLNFNFK